MTATSTLFTEYEAGVLREMATHQVRPNALERALEGLGGPVSKLLKAGRESSNRLIRRLSDGAQGVVEESIIGTIKIARHLTVEEAVIDAFRGRGYDLDDLGQARHLPLEALDRVANSFHVGSAVLLGTEGAALGAATTLAYTFPGTQLLVSSLILADVSSSMTLLARHACKIGSAYGFSSQLPRTLPHLVAAMAPPTRTSDEGYLALKTAVVGSIREANQFLSRTAVVAMDRQIMEREAPQLIRLITYVAERLGVIVTEKNLSILVPVAGAALNAGVNMAFQQVGHLAAKDYFRRLILDERYGAEAVEDALRQEVSRLS
jgi:hypothetical protein